MIKLFKKWFFINEKNKVPENEIYIQMPPGTQIPNKFDIGDLFINKNNRLVSLIIEKEYIPLRDFKWKKLPKEISYPDVESWIYKMKNIGCINNEKWCKEIDLLKWIKDGETTLQKVKKDEP